MHSLPVAAFMAGLISFLSPCVLPLVPGYISLISGAGVEELKQSNGHLMRAVLLNSILFILGFSTIFLYLGRRSDHGRTTGAATYCSSE